jgi:hypothetical protein
MLEINGNVELISKDGNKEDLIGRKCLHYHY